MPFTLAHPAAALPIRRWLGRRVVPSALVIGTMIPDLPYYIDLDWRREWTHSIASLFWWALPAGWACFLLYRKVLRAPLAYLLPEPLRTRMSPTPAPSPAAAVTLSLLLGALSHLLWDALTHESPLFFGAAANSSAFDILQNGSSVLGLAVIGWWLWRLPRHKPRQPKRHPEIFSAAARDVWRAVLCVIPLVVGVSYAVWRLPRRTDTVGLVAFLTPLLVQGTSACLLLLIAMGLVWRWKAHRRAGATALETGLTPLASGSLQAPQSGAWSTPVGGGTGSDTRSPP